MLLGAVDELHRVLKQPHLLVSLVVKTLGDEQQVKLLSGAPDKIEAALSLLERAPSALETAKARGSPPGTLNTHMLLPKP